MYPVAVVQQYTKRNTILYYTQKTQITHTNSKQYITQKLQTQSHKITNTMHTKLQT